MESGIQAASVGGGVMDEVRFALQPCGNEIILTKFVRGGGRDVKEPSQ
jgi:hypothetical protein